MNESLYKVSFKTESTSDYDYLLFDDKLSIGEVNDKVLLFLERKYSGTKILESKWNMIAWYDNDASRKIVKTCARDNNRYFGAEFDKPIVLSIGKSDIENLTNEELRVFFFTENIEDSRTPAIIKDYVLQGKETFSMGERINEVEKIIMTVVTERFISGEIK